jgi:hypothetical protein
MPGDTPQSPSLPSYDLLSVLDLRIVLGCGEHAALSLARKIGVRIGERKWVVERSRLDAYLRGGQNADAA